MGVLPPFAGPAPAGGVQLPNFFNPGVVKPTGQNPLANVMPPTIPAPAAAAPAGGPPPTPAPPPPAPAGGLAGNNPAQQIPPNLLPAAGGANNPQNSMVNYLQFAQWWQQNIGQNPPPFQSWLGGIGGTAQPGSQADPNVAGGAGNPNTPDVLGGQADFNSPEAFQQLIAAMAGQASPGLQFAGRDFDPGSRLNALNELGGGFTGGPFGLPGQEGDAVAGVIANLLFNEAGLQTGRSGEAESILRNVMDQLGGSAARGTAQQAATLAGERLDPASLDALRQSMQSDLSTSLAAERNASTNAMREQGILGQGATAGAALGGLTNRLGGLRQQGQFDITRMMEQLTGQRLGQASEAARTGIGAEQALVRDPSQALAGALLGPRNAAIGPINDFLQGVLNLNVGEALANRGGSFFDRGGGALIGSLLGSAGNVLSAPVSGGSSVIGELLG